MLLRMNIRTARAAKAEYKTHRIAGVQHDVMCKAVDNIGKTGHLRKSMVVRVVRGRKKKSELKAKCSGDVVARNSKYRIVLLQPRRRVKGTGQHLSVSAQTMLDFAYTASSNITALATCSNMDRHTVRRYQTFVAWCYLKSMANACA